MPHSIFTGRPWPQPGEPLFLPEDTDLAIALAEEERDTCSMCGLPKAWCRDPANRFSFDASHDFCWATYRSADHRKAQSEKMGDSQRASMQISARFRKGHEPDIGAGLDLPNEAVDPKDH